MVRRMILDCNIVRLSKHFLHPQNSRDQETDEEIHRTMKIHYMVIGQRLMQFMDTLV